MARTPTKTEPKSLSKGQEALLRALERGERPPEIAKRLYPNDKRKAKKLRSRLWYKLRHDIDLQKAIVERGQANLMLGIIPATVGLSSRAGRKTDAAKYVLEATGVHNPKVKHEHSGEISIKLDIPRPKFVDATASDDGETVIGPAD